MKSDVSKPLDDNALLIAGRLPIDPFADTDPVEAPSLARQDTRTRQKKGGHGHGIRARVRCLADVQARDVEWLWSDRLPAGMVSILDGPASIGKSTLVIDIIARLTTGRPLATEAASRPPMNVVLLGQEDSPEHTIRPRLDSAGADTNRVHLLADIGGKMLRLPDDGDELEHVVRMVDAKLVVIDPVSAYIGQADLHRDNEVRAALAPLATIADRTGASVLMIRHLRKSGGVDAIGRGLGSVGIMALARCGLMLLQDPEDPSARVLTWSKMSVGPVPRSVRWRLQSTEAHRPPQIAWGETCDLSADDILTRQDRAMRSGGHAAATAVDGAEEWLMRQFEQADAIPTSELRERSSREGIAWRTVERAKGKLGIRARRDSVPGGQGAGWWMWVVTPKGRDHVPTVETKTARQVPLTALSHGDSTTSPNPASFAGSGDIGNTANRKTPVSAMASLVDAEQGRAQKHGDDAANA